MDFAVLWAVVFLILAVLFLIVLIILKYFKSKKKNSRGLFGDMAPHYFKGVFKRINPFLIVRKRGKSPQFGTNASEEKFIVFQDSLPPAKKGSSKRESSENPYERKSATGYNRKGGMAAGLRQESNLLQKSSLDSRELQHVTSKKESIFIKVDDLSSLSKKLGNRDIAHVLEYLKKENYSLIEKLFVGKTFDSEDEFMRYLQEEIVRFLESEVGLLKERISGLRKKGLDVSDIDYRVMSVPLKIKLFSASFNRNDFDKVVLMIDKIDEELKKFELAREHAEKEKENRELEKK